MSRFVVALLALTVCCGASSALVTADFDLSPGLYVSAGSPVTVDGLLSHTDSAGGIVSYEWQWNSPAAYLGQPADEFGFAADASGAQQSYIYPAIGSYRLTLRATDDLGDMGIAQQFLMVRAMMTPTAVPGGPYTVSVGQDIVLDGLASFDPDILYGDQIVSYEWFVNTQWPTLISGSRPTLPWAELESRLLYYGYTDPVGVYLLGLRVEDTTGRSSIGYTSLTVTPESTNGLPTSVPEPATLSLLALGCVAALLRRYFA